MKFGLTILVAFLILVISVAKTTSFYYAQSPIVLSEKTESNGEPIIDYILSYPGKINPDNPIWYAKVIRDKTWYMLTFNKQKKASLNLLFADKRLNSSIELFKNNKPDLGLATLSKAERYLEKSESVIGDDTDFYKKILLASLKHREVIEKVILPMTPEDLRAGVIKTENYSTDIYKKVSEHMIQKGLIPQENPFKTN